jgi:hypothetical protein
MFMPLPIEFDLDVLLVQGQHCLNVGLRDMKVTLHDVCGGLLATAVEETSLSMFVSSWGRLNWSQVAVASQEWKLKLKVDCQRAFLTEAAWQMAIGFEGNETLQFGHVDARNTGLDFSHLEGESDAVTCEEWYYFLCREKLDLKSQHSVFLSFSYLRLL